MDHACFEDSSDKLETAGLENVMKSFNFSLYLNTSEIKDIFDVQNIMREGRIDDFTKCIRSLLNYSFNTYTSDSNVKVLDSSFIKFFHVAQVIIRFLLHWKSELFKENTKLKSQIQELEKLRKESFSRKLEIKDLKKRLAKYQRLDDELKPTGISECSQCRKIFVNPTFLYAHHRRRHGDQPFTSVENETEMKMLKDEICELKQRLNSLNHEECATLCTLKETEDTNKTPAVPLKMKIFPELSCLEAQEKFWKGKLKDVYHTFEKEKQSMKNFLNELTAENSRLRQELANIQVKPSSSSIAVQTNTPAASTEDEIRSDRRARLTENYERVRKYLSKDSLSKFTPDREQSTAIPEVRRRPSFPSNQILDLQECRPSLGLRFLDHNLRIRDDNTEDLRSDETDLPPRRACPTFQESDLFDSLRPAVPVVPPRLISNLPTVTEPVSDRREETDIVEQVNTFLAKYKGQKNKLSNENIPEKSSLPGDEDRRDEEKKVIMKFFTTERLADKLIKIYDKRRSLVDEVESDTRGCEDEVTGTDVRINRTDCRVEVVSATTSNDLKISNGVNDSNEDSQPENRSYLDASEISASTSRANVNVDHEIVAISSTPSSAAKEKSNFLPFFRNIPSKIAKNYSKSRKMCANIIEDKIIRKLSTRTRDEVATEMPHDDDSLRCEITTDETTESICAAMDSSHTNYARPPALIQVAGPERKLVSALKKSRSTGNIMKKVAFTDDLPSLKTVSDWDLRQVPRTINTNSPPESRMFTVGTAQVHFDRLAKPIPAPRSKKSVIVNVTNHR